MKEEIRDMTHIDIDRLTFKFQAGIRIIPVR